MYIKQYDYLCLTTWRYGKTLRSWNHAFQKMIHLDTTHNSTAQWRSAPKFCLAVSRLAVAEWFLIRLKSRVQLKYCTLENLFQSRIYDSFRTDNVHERYCIARLHRSRRCRSCASDFMCVTYHCCQLSVTCREKFTFESLISEDLFVAIDFIIFDD